jgi:hypothetical protein
MAASVTRYPASVSPTIEAGSMTRSKSAALM